MRVLQIIDSFVAGGKERQLLELIKGLKKHPEIDCRLVVQSDVRQFDEFERLQIRTYMACRKSRYDPGVFRTLYGIFREFAPDIVHSWNSMCSIRAAPIAWLTGAAFVDGSIRNATSDTRVRRKHSLRGRMIRPFADAIVANSRAGLDLYAVPASKGACIHNGFDFGRIARLTDPVRVRAALGIETPHVVGMVAAFSARKDYETFIQAARIVLTKRNDVTFVAVGEGDQLNMFRRRADVEGADRIRLLGRRSDVEDIVNIFTIGVLFSTFGEGISNAVIEYMALEKPVIATDCPGNREIVEDGATGYLVPPHDPASAAERIMSLLAAPGTMSAFGLAARQRIASNFSQENMIAEYLAIYRNSDRAQELAGENARRPGWISRLRARLKAMRKPRVVLVGPWPPTQGGVTTFMLNVAASPLGERFEILRYSTSRPLTKETTDFHGYRAMLRGGVLRLLAVAALTGLRLAWFPVWALLHRPDVVQIQASDFQAFWEASLYCCWCRLLRIPVLMRLGGSFDRFYETSSAFPRKLIRFVLSLPDLLIVQSDYWRAFVAELGRHERIVVLPNFVPDALVSTRVLHAADAEPLCLFMAGTMALHKGADETIEAIALLRNRNVGVRFSVVAAMQSLQERIAAADLDGAIEVAGFLSHAETLERMRAADIFLLPSHGEGFPNSLIEAMASGLACIASAVGAIPEIVGSDGAILVPPRDARALADAIERLASDPLERARIAKRGQSIVGSCFVESVVLDVLEGAWRSVLARGPAQA